MTNNTLLLTCILIRQQKIKSFNKKNIDNKKLLTLVNLWKINSMTSKKEHK